MVGREPARHEHGAGERHGRDATITSRVRRSTGDQPRTNSVIPISPKRATIPSNGIVPFQMSHGPNVAYDRRSDFGLAGRDSRD